MLNFQARGLMKHWQTPEHTKGFKFFRKIDLYTDQLSNKGMVQTTDLSRKIIPDKISQTGA